MPNDTASKYLKAAWKLADFGFHVFPLAPNGKRSVVEDFSHVSTRDPEKIRLFWIDEVMNLYQPYNVGIAMRGLYVAVDVDVKDGRGGDESVFSLELEGCIFPKTFTQYTPSGGTHFVYRLPPGCIIRNSVQALAPGVDIRGLGGLLVGAGSTIDDVIYSANWEPIVDAPRWLLDRVARSAALPAVRVPDKLAPVVSREIACKRARFLLESTAGASQGSRDSRAYSLACELSNLGVDELDATDLLDELWAPRCDPPFPLDDLITPVSNAYRYVRDKGPVSAPEMDFDVVEEDPEPARVKTPLDVINDKYAFVLSGGGHHILFETLDSEGRPTVDHLCEATFHAARASDTYLTTDGKPKPWSRRWMSSPFRRSYQGFCFSPGKTPPDGFYNLFRGFTVEPNPEGSDEAKESVRIWLEHARENICNGIEEHFKWVMGYFAHLVQRPYEKPFTSLVLKGRKGVGKNAFVDRIGHILGSHYKLASDRRYVVGNFNSILEKCLLLTLDEAFWSGDKAAEGKLKDLITGTTHLIERKGQEPYEAKNLTRVIVLGNEDWLVPASEDERRYAVFEVGEARQQDNSYFHKMRVGMENGGYAILMDYLMNFDLSTVDINRAPQTKALLQQKLHSQDLFGQWWADCLENGAVNDIALSSSWPKVLRTDELRDSYRAYHRRRNSRALIGDERILGKRLHVMCRSLVKKRARDESGGLHYEYAIPSLGKARKEFSEFLRHDDMDWGDE